MSKQNSTFNLQPSTFVLPDLSDRTAWVIGKGPSFEGYYRRVQVHPRVDPRAVVVGINQVCTVVDCDYAFANDPQVVEQLRGAWPLDCRMVLPGHLLTAAEKQDVRCLPYEATNIRVGGWDHDGYIVERDEGRGTRDEGPADFTRTPTHAPRPVKHLRLVHWLGTPLTALQFLRVCGCRQVVTVGLDGVGGYSRFWGNACGADSEHQAILGGFREYAGRWGMDVRRWILEDEG